jgi:type II secretory ATPase GspE/PulE/Tfp pilus assembly ATPase PilB-like protein/DNA-binding response OmpR family regulator
VTSDATKVLAVVEDDDVLRSEIARHFADGYDVKTYTGEPATLTALKQLRPNALLLDLDLDLIDAFAVLRLLGTAPELRGVPAVAIASEADAATVKAACRTGAAEVVPKPVALDELRSLVDHLVAVRTQRTAGRLKLGALLVASGLVGREQLERALDRQRREGGRLGEILVREGMVGEQDIVAALAGQMRIGVVDFATTAPERAAMALLSREFIVRHRLLPLRIEENGTLVLAMTNPLDVISIDEVGMRTRRRVVPVICSESAFDEALVVYFSSRGKLTESSGDGDEELSETVAVDESIIEIVDALLADATGMSASDIHLEPREGSLHVRCRIDGVLHDLRDLPKESQAGVISRLKIIGGMNIAERRLPQDGRSTFELPGGDTVDLRLATIPSLYGEHITIRILEVSPLPPSLGDLGLTGASLERYQQALSAPEGGISIVGPTGCGKSTTLYTTLELIRSVERKLYTVEDPVERKIDGVVQTEVRPGIGLTFAQALRALVRADPDVIMVGEIRDLETAKMAADAAITGHKVFSTLHTNDASAAVSRLVEMGVPRYLVAAAWRCFVAQRLVRRLCPHCRKAVTMNERSWVELGLGPAPKQRMKVYEPVGCPQCFNTGYRGRLGLYEVLVIDDEMRELLASGGSVLDIQRMAREKGVTSLRDDGIEKVLSGATSHLELLRATV